MGRHHCFVHARRTDKPQTTVDRVLGLTSPTEITDSSTHSLSPTLSSTGGRGNSIANRPGCTWANRVRSYFQTPSRFTLQYNVGSASHMVTTRYNMLHKSNDLIPAEIKVQQGTRICHYIKIRTVITLSGVKIKSMSSPTLAEQVT